MKRPGETKLTEATVQYPWSSPHGTSRATQGMKGTRCHEQRSYLTAPSTTHDSILGVGMGMGCGVWGVGGRGGNISAEAYSKSSMNCISKGFAQDPANRAYSSNIALKDQFCRRRRHPMAQPV